MKKSQAMIESACARKKAPAELGASAGRSHAGSPQDLGDRRCRDADADAAALAGMSNELPAVDGAVVRLTLRDRRGAIVEAVRRLSDAGVGVDDLALRGPTLDDVFLALTGRAADGSDDGDGFVDEGERAA